MSDDRRIMSLRCRFGYHDWNLAFRKVGEHQQCKRCGVIAIASDRGWIVNGKIKSETALRVRR